MTKVTDQRGYPYPECAPPLTKDRSDIWFLQQLAATVNNDADTLEARLIDFVEKPDAARIAFAGNIAVSGSPGASFVVPYSAATYYTRIDALDLTNFALKPPEMGFYIFVSTVRCTNGGEIGMGLRLLRNGAPPYEARRYEGPSAPLGTEENMTMMTVLKTDGNDYFQTQVKTSNAVAGSYAFEAQLTMIQLQRLDV